LSVVLAAVLPILAFTSFLLIWQVDQRQRAVEQGMADTASALASAVDQQIHVWRAVLNALAASPALATGDLASFYFQASAVARQHDANFVLFDESLRQRMNTLVAYGQPLPGQLHDPDAVRRVFATGEPQVRGPLRGTPAKEWFIAVEVPVMGRGRVMYDLIMFFEPQVLSDLLFAQDLPAGRVAVITSAENKFVARSQDIAHYIGAQAAPPYIEAVSGRDSGIFEGRLRTGPSRIIAFHRLREAPWTVAVAVSESALVAEPRRLFLVFAAFALFAVGAAAVLAWLFSRRVTEPLAALASSADDVLRGNPTTLKPLAIQEFEILRRALEKTGEAARAAIAAQERAAALEANAELLRKNEERQRFLAREIDHRSKNLLAIVQSVVQLTRAEDVETFSSAVSGRLMALAHAHSLLADSRWEGASLGQIIEDELAPYRTGDERIELKGPSVVLNPAAAQTMALALHELTTNAVKYGALSAPSGRLSVSWTIGSDAFVLEWKETGGPAIPGPPARRGFGTRLVTSTIESQLGGEISLHWLQQGLHAILSLPRTQLVATGGGQVHHGNDSAVEFPGA
jgi:two-component sensor histidine kinase